MDSQNTFLNRIGKHSIIEGAMAQFRNEHDLKVVAKKSGKGAQVLRNKLNPDQDRHHLTVLELVDITRATRDTSIIDAVLLELNICAVRMPGTKIPNNGRDFIGSALEASISAGELSRAVLEAQSGLQPTKLWLLKTRRVAMEAAQSAMGVVVRIDNGCMTSIVTDLAINGGLSLMGAG